MSLVMARSITEIKADILTARERVWALEDELKRFKENRKATCPHTTVRERDMEDTYYEEGRMTVPARLMWKERFCTLCGKVLATNRLKKKETWTGWEVAD